MRTSTIALILIFAALTLPAAADQGFVQSLQWRSPDGVAANGLFVFRKNESVYNERMLFEASDGRRFVLSARLDARSGSDTVRLTDDESGWWLEVVTDYRHRAQDMKTFLHSMRPEEAEPPKTIGISLATKDGQTFALKSVPFSARDVEHHDALANAFLDGGARLKIPEEVRTALATELPFLDLAFGEPYAGTGYSFRAPIDVLRALLGTKTSSKNVAVKVLHHTRGLVLRRNEDLSLAARFRLIATPIEPLGPIEQ